MRDITHKDNIFSGDSAYKFVTFESNTKKSSTQQIEREGEIGREQKKATKKQKIYEIFY